MPTANSDPKTLALTVRNTAFLLDRLGEDCHPLQFLRELTQNGLEAIERIGGRGEIVWDVEWNRYDLDPRAFKLCVIDTGDGMTGEEMVRYINQLSSSLTKQSLYGNYGVGAKIAAATRNREGLIYLSWKNGRGAMIHLWRDPELNVYGLRQFQRPDGSFDHWAEVEDALKPEAIKEHGTMVVLLGNDELDDTVKAPLAAPSPSRWIAKYLNSRYFSLPKNVTVRAREGWEHPRSDRDRNLLRRITGQAEYLEQHSDDSGRLKLAGATAHWWILKDEAALSQNSGFIESSGHVAALFKNELYELATGRGGRARLQQFGVLFGHNRVVLYLEPDEATQVVTNTARTNLLLAGEPLPWAEWAADFREHMPREIRQLIEEVAAAAGDDDHSSSIRERLKQIMDLFKVSRYRPASTGAFTISDDRLTHGGVPSPSRRTGTDGGGGRSGKAGGTAGNLYSLFLKADGVRGELVHPDVFPMVKWISIKDGTREPGDCEDRAARFLTDQNVLLINGDFRVFTDMSSRWVRQFDERTVGPVVVDVVRSWFEQALVETVIGVQAMRGSKEWSIEEVDRALSEEALTAAVMQRYHINNSVKRELGSKLGKIPATS